MILVLKVRSLLLSQREKWVGLDPLDPVIMAAILTMIQNEKFIKNYYNKPKMS